MPLNLGYVEFWDRVLFCRRQKEQKQKPKKTAVQAANTK